MLEDILKERAAKRAAIEQKEKTAYPARVKRTHTVSALITAWTKLARAGKPVAVAGRVMGLRRQGGLIFLDLADGTGKIQGVVKKDDFKNFDFIRDHIDIGDFAAASGKLFVTKAGQKSVDVRVLTIAAKALRPIPSEFYGLKDEETRFRKRYLDLLINPGERELFIKKAKFWHEVRAIMTEAGYLEVETPVLESVPGGAEAEPFVTHHNALDQDFYLRISLELALKRLMVAGYEKVFEIGRIFRNEGISKEHLQDYTQMECYAAYEDYRSLMKFMEKSWKRVIKATTGKLVTVREGKKINWGGRWKTYDYYDLWKKGTGLDLKTATREAMFEKARLLKLEGVDEKLGRGRLIDLLFKATVRPKLVEPGFLIDPPVDIEPLAKRTEYDPGRVERFQIVAGGTELGKGFSELNDPVDQRARFEEQMKLRAAGDKEAQMIDEDYVESMEYGMPPTAGFGMSERLFAFLMDRPVRETVIFPLLRKK